MKNSSRGFARVLATAPGEDYGSTCTYSDDGRARRRSSFVASSAERRRGWSGISAATTDGSPVSRPRSDFIVALDSDPVVVDGLYLSLRERREPLILPLVVDLANPSPAVGWRNAERSTLLERGARTSSCALRSSTTSRSRATSRCASSFDWLRSLDCEVVVEFPDRDDPMVQRCSRRSGRRASGLPPRDVRALLRGQLRDRSSRASSPREREPLSPSTGLSSPLPSYRLRAAHLIAVWAYAVSQPIFSMLDANPEFVLVRGSTRTRDPGFRSCHSS